MLYTIIGKYVRVLRANEITSNHVGFPDKQNVLSRPTNMSQSLNAIIAILCWVIIADTTGDIVRNEDICGAQDGRRLYLELGEKGILYAKNLSFAKNESRRRTSRAYSTNSSHDQCSLELVTCPSCVIIVTFRSLTLSHHCGDGGVTIDSPCRCDYVWISEPPYEDVSGTPFCGLYAPITYRSSTRTLSITLLYSQPHTHAFTLEYTAERNRLHLRGSELMTGGAKGLNSTGGGILTSPFFPARYPRDLGLEYIVTCPSESPSCRIRLLFSDFQLATVSIMEFYDWNGQRLDVSSGARFRPPVIMSSGPSLLIRFYANGGTGLGYKAFYSFVIGHLFDKSVQPITDCGGYVENLGGAITMIDMVEEGVKTYDCVWLIRPPKNFMHMKTHVYIKVITFVDMAGNTELVIKQGPTSALLPLEILRHPTRQVQPPRYREHIAPITSGFHVSLRGTFGPPSHLAIAYAAFSYTDCFAGSDFLCQNHRCIPNELNCDGFDHCGDDSDEPSTCFRDWDVEPQDRKWHTNKANYYFPKIDRYPDLKTATLVFVASSLGLIVLISALIILLYRVGARARQQRELQSRLQTISELLVFDIVDGARIDEISVADDPPVYEAPPGYDEVVKLSLEREGVRSKKRNFNREPRSRSSPSQRSLDLVQSATCLVFENAGTSRGSQTTPIPSTAGNQAKGHLPESPPPPYITPPGTIVRKFSMPGLSSTPDLRDPTEHNSEEGPCNRDWFRRSSHFSLSLSSGSEARMHDLERSSEARLEGSSTSIEAEALGAYRRHRDAPSSPICTSDASSDSQPKNSRDASTDIEPGCEQKPEEGQLAEANKVEGAVAEPKEGPEEGPEDATKVERDSTPGCSCEGACGCAIDHRIFLKNDVQSAFATTSAASSSFVNEDSADTIADNAFESIPDRQEILEQEKDEYEGKESEEDLSRSRSTIARLIGSRVGKRQNGSGGSTTTSTATSTPSGTFRRSSRKFSVCSRDSYVSKISSLGSCSVGGGSSSSYEKLQDEVDVAPKVSLDSTPSTRTPKNLQRIQRYASCDLDSLYEGIKVLDGFLARRGFSVAHPRKQSVAVMLFGTPEHGTTVRRQVADVENTRRGVRVWRSSEDTLSN